jgi:hypothetical protein
VEEGWVRGGGVGERRRGGREEEGWEGWEKEGWGRGGGMGERRRGGGVEEG